jgi:gamma-glutamyltranspeptidase/glutathione hydrolase
MVVAPHFLAAEAGRQVLREGGNAIEAIVAAAAVIAVVYPHMNGLGGDNFWLITEGGQAPIGIDACGAAAGLATRDYYRELGHAAGIPARGPAAALTVAGAVSGWTAALECSRAWGGRLPLTRLLADAIGHARSGYPVSATQARNTVDKRTELETLPGFSAVFMPGGGPPAPGSLMPFPLLAQTLEHLARAGLDDFYRGELAGSLARDLRTAGSPLRRADLERHQARMVRPLCVQLHAGAVFGMPPPTQGLASLMILGLFDRLGVREAEGMDHIHGLVEATKRAFLVRDAYVTDPAYMRVDAQAFLAPAFLDSEALKIDPRHALPWPQPAAPGDTVWLGAIDGRGRAVSFIQSIYWEFGSGLVLPASGIVWQNRGTSFSLDADRQNALEPLRRPFHTIQPALALLDDGRVMPFGTMGGEGQPQTKAAIYTRHVIFGQDLAHAISAPRWLLGRTWGSAVTSLRMESRFDPALVAALRAAGHEIELVGPFEEMMGHAGALVLHRAAGRAGVIEGAADPRCDGCAAGC